MKKKILFGVCLLFGLLLVNSGLNKFFNYMPVPEDLPAGMADLMGCMMAFGWLMPLVGLVEIVSGILIVFPKTRALAAIMIFPVVVGIVLTHTVNETSGLPIALVVLAVNLWVFFENRRKYMPMLTA
jgi:uncharacterized membrane protein YphA (DoxX/SURF4 family)